MSELLKFDIKILEVLESESNPDYLSDKFNHKVILLSLKFSIVMNQIIYKEYQQKTISQLFPEYYLININRFNDVAKDTLDEWIFFLKNEEIKEEFSAKGLIEMIAEIAGIAQNDVKNILK